MFTGEYRHTVDDKGRIAVPVKFRAQLDPGSMISGWLDDCLAIHTKTAWEELSNKIAALPITDDKARLFARFVFSHATEAEMDKQGRVLLPASVARIGRPREGGRPGRIRDHAEIWAPDRWDSYRKALDDPRELASAFKGLGI